jgi:hypothetical protein
MSYASRVGRITLLWIACGLTAFGQTSARLQTSDTELALEAGPAVPRLASFAVPEQLKWENQRPHPDLTGTREGFPPGGTRTEP